MKRELEQKQLHRMGKVLDISEMWYGCQNLYAIQKESQAQYKPLAVMGYISDTEVIIKASQSSCQHGGAAGFELSEWSPLPPA